MPLAISLGLFDNDDMDGGLPPGVFVYFRPDGTSLYDRPDGTSIYFRP